MTELLSSSEMLPVLASAEAILRRFSAVPPELLASRALLQRVDRKYALPAHQVGSIAARLFGAYSVLRAGNALAARYRTVYYDTDDLCLYHAHRRGQAVRYKVRVRHHVDRQMSFVEVKRRNAPGRSNKFVLTRPFGISALDDEAQAFVERHCPVPVRELRPRVWIEFRRITLVGCDVDERITFDCDLEYWDSCRSERWPHAAIAEVKQGRRSNHSPSIQALRSARVIERSISKYAVATARLSDVRGNAFRPAVLALERTSR
jgi:hypothetical protein